MRILAVGSLYPPHHLGGYELVWESAVAHLRSAGHEVRVVASDHRQPGVVQPDPPEADVHRDLRWYWRDHRFPRMGPAARLSLERQNATAMDRHLDDFAPAVVAWWSMGGMSLSLVERVHRACVPAVAVVHDDWPVYGPRVDGWLRMASRLPAPLAGVLDRRWGIPTSVSPGAIDRWLFVSEHVRDRAGMAGDVLPSGIHADFLVPAPEREWEGRLLVVGRIDPRKGIDTAIDALASLPGATLEVVGEGDPDHLAQLRARAARDDVAGRVSFAGALHRAGVRARYAAADAVLFPVRWDEPWGLVPLEAMGTGRPVVATGRGGSAEYLRHGENCLMFAAGDAEGLAEAVRRLADDAGLRARLREGGLATAARHTARAFDRGVERALVEAAARERG